MRGLVITFIFMVGSFTACFSIFKDTAKDSSSTNYTTDKIRYERAGGGNLDFTISDSDENLIVNITRLEFRDVNLHLRIIKSEIDPDDLKMIESVFNGTVDIGGEIPVNLLPTGTWNYVYVMSGDEWTKVGSKLIVDELSSFEIFIRSKIQ